MILELPVVMVRFARFDANIKYGNILHRYLLADLTGNDSFRNVGLAVKELNELVKDDNTHRVDLGWMAPLNDTYISVFGISEDFMYPPTEDIFEETREITDQVLGVTFTDSKFIFKKW